MELNTRSEDNTVTFGMTPKKQPLPGEPHDTVVSLGAWCNVWKHVQIWESVIETLPSGGIRCLVRPLVIFVFLPFCRG